MLEPFFSTDFPAIKTRMYLIRAFCHPTDEDHASRMLTRILDTRERKAWHASYLHQALMALAEDADDAKEFKSLLDHEGDKLRGNIIVKRTGVSHSKAAEVTPDVIKYHDGKNRLLANHSCSSLAHRVCLVRLCTHTNELMSEKT